MSDSHSVRHVADTAQSERIPASGTLAWAFYDWASSAFAAVIITFVFATYFSQGIASDPVTGTAQWGWAMTVSAMFAAVLGPILGAFADAIGRRKPWIFVLTWLCIIATSLLWFAEPSVEWVLFALIAVVVANLALELAGIFYNAMLSDLTSAGRMGRLSGWSWALGYVGGICCLLIALFGLVQTEAPLFGLNKDTAEHVRATGPLVALWLALFSLPLFLFTPDRQGTGLSMSEALSEGLQQLRRTVTHLKRYKQIAHFLLARMLYIDGLNTLFAFGGIYAAGTFGFELADVITFGILLNVTAGLGAFAFAWIDDWLGSKPVILIALAGLFVCGLAAVLVQNEMHFWIVGSLLGIFVGPTQAASRTLMAKLSPPEQQTEMFGLYALSGKITAFLGPFIVGTVTLWADSQRVGMTTILLFFAAGFALLLALQVRPRDEA
ncbi:MAG: MFS transporter [Geminicoccaceae bacterium]